MKASELRIGNYVYEEGVKYITSTGHTMILATGIYKFNKEEMNLLPIPLTEEWLLKFGFWQCNEDKITKRYSHEINPFIQLVSTNNWMSNKLVVTQRQELLANIQYVHQLQNLYFALTGEELHL